MFSGIFYLTDKSWLYLILSATCVLPCFSQKLNTLTVEAPFELAGDYALARPAWGSQTNNSLTAGAVYAQPVTGCESLTNHSSGKIVFLDRGSCAFDVKALNAQTAGAVAVIICQNVSAPEPLFEMAAGNVAVLVNIPVFLATQETCKTLKVALNAGSVMATIGFKCATPTYASNVIWGSNPGEGDFSNGLDGWTTDKGWFANPEGIVRSGAYTGTPRVVGSATSCNGIAEFNADHLDNRSVAGAFGTGDCPAPCKGYLLSPNITFTQPLSGLVFEFNQSLRQFQSQYYVMVSTDNGVTFRDTLQFNTEYPVNSAHITERKRIAFPGFEGATQIRFKFEIIGNYYYWALDDIVIIDERYTDLKIDRTWYAVAPIYKLPASQVSEIPFMADIRNEGNITATDVSLQLTVTGPATQDSSSISLGNVEANSTRENMPFPLVYTSPAWVGIYKAEYYISGMEENDGPDNRAGFQWKVTEKTFGNLDTEGEFGSPYMQFYAAAWLGVPDDKNYSIGNIYYVPHGHGMIASKVRFGLENPLSEVIGQTIRFDLFEWEDKDDSNTSSPDERKRIGSNILLLDENISNPRYIETDIWPSDADGYPIEGSRVLLKDRTTYLITATVLPNRPELDPQIKLLGYTPRGLDDYDRSIGHMLATHFALDSLERAGMLKNRSAGSLFAWENTGVVYDVIDRNFRFIFNGTLYTKAFLEMDVEHIVQSQDVDLDPAAINVFPNPAARELFIDFNLDKETSSAVLSMYSPEGKLVYHVDYPTISNNRIKLDVSGFSNGIYNLKVKTDGGIANRRIIVLN